MSAVLRTGNDNNDGPVKLKKNSSRMRNGIARGSRLVLPAMAALGIGGPASAFELGALDVHSTLGQPLRASIAFALSPGEEIRGYCIYLNAGRSANGLPSAGPASVAVENGSIRLFGATPVNDPLLALQVTVDCPYAAHLRRDYVAFVDPAKALAAGEPAAVETPRNDARPAPVTARRPAARTPVAISAAATYRVQPGDTLSGIAQRLSGRSVTIWQAVEALFAANTHAFIDNDRDFLKAGALLRVPEAIYTADGGAIARRAAPAEQPAAAASEAPPPASTAYSGYRREAARIENGRARRAAASVVAPAPAVESESTRSQPADEPTVNRLRELQQAPDLRVDGGPFVEPVEAAGEAGAAPAEVAPAAILPESRPAGEFAAPLTRQSDNGGAWSWLMWLGGSGIALILALLLLGRPLRQRFGGEAELRFGEDDEADRRRERGAAAPRPMPISAATPADATSGMEVDFHVDEGLDARLVMVDGDVEDGRGFQDSDDIDVAQDFGFSASGGMELGLDVDFSEEPAPAAGTGDTNVVPPMRRAGDVIVENEIPPGSEETGAYDVSMIVDATQQPIGDGDDTTRDLHAVELDTGDADAAPEEDPYTLSREVDYKILEQDYQEELTATQALDAELSNAARDLAERLENAEGAAAAPDAPTAEFPTLGSEETVPHPAAVRALADADTVEMPAKQDDDLDDTGVNEELKDMPAAGNDATAEMEIESATVDTKKVKAS